MACRSNCRLCHRLVISQSVTFTGGVLIVNLPAGNYGNNEKYCVIIAQNIPNTATINAPVVFTIGTGTQQYPLIGKNCRQVTACGIQTRTRYATCVRTTPTVGTFQLQGNPCCTPNNDLRSINGTAPATTASTSLSGKGAL